jgi:hypothetical protein
MLDIDKIRAAYALLRSSGVRVTLNVHVTQEDFATIAAAEDATDRHTLTMAEGRAVDEVTLAGGVCVLGPIRDRAAA